MTEKEMLQKEAEWAQEKSILTRKAKIKKEKKALKGKKISTTKLIMLFLFLNCSIIEIFTGWATVQSLNMASMTGLPADFSPLVTLIGAVVGEIIGFAVYALKSTKENTAGGIVYDQAMYELQHNSNEEAQG